MSSLGMFGPQLPASSARSACRPWSSAPYAAVRRVDLPPRGVGGDGEELLLLVDDGRQVAAQQREVGAQVSYAAEEHPDVSHTATAVKLPVDTGVEEGFLGLEVVVEGA